MPGKDYLVRWGRMIATGPKFYKNFQASFSSRSSNYFSSKKVLSCQRQLPPTVRQASNNNSQNTAPSGLAASIHTTTSNNQLSHKPLLNKLLRQSLNLKRQIIINLQNGLSFRKRKFTQFLFQKVPF